MLLLKTVVFILILMLRKADLLLSRERTTFLTTCHHAGLAIFAKGV